MWPLALVGGLITLVVLAVALPLIVILGIKAIAGLLAGSEIEDDQP